MATRCRAARCSSGRLHEGGLDLLKPDLAFLLGRSRCVGHGGSLLQTASLRHMAPSAVDEGVVQDREQPAPQVAARAERASPLIGPHKGILHQVLGLGFVARQRSGIAPQGPEQPDDVHALGVVHVRYTKLMTGLIRPAVRFSSLGCDAEISEA